MQPRAGTLVTPTVRLSRQLGQGGMGAVWLADHLGLHTRVAVKFISAELARDSDSVARFSREASSASQVRSSHVVQIFDHGVTPEGLPFIVMEFLDGEDLARRLHRLGRLPPREIVSIVTQAAKALSRAHSLSIVHRDIKPDNIFLVDEDGDLVVKLLDFGIAKITDQMGATRTGSMIGTPFYMSPEQAIGAKAIDHRTDLWSLGVVTFQMATGRRPFEGDTVGALTLAIHHGELPRPSRFAPELGTAFDDWFRKACARDPKERFASAKEMAQSLAIALAITATIESADRSGGHAAALSATVSASADPDASGPAPAVHAPSPPMTTTAATSLAAESLEVAGMPRRGPALVFAAIAALVVAVAAAVVMRARVSPTSSPAAETASTQPSVAPTAKAVAEVTPDASPSVETIAPPAKTTATAAKTALPKVPAKKVPLTTASPDDDDKLK